MQFILNKFYSVNKKFITLEKINSEKFILAFNENVPLDVFEELKNMIIDKRIILTKENYSKRINSIHGIIRKYCFKY